MVTVEAKSDFPLVEGSADLSGLSRPPNGPDPMAAYSSNNGCATARIDSSDARGQNGSHQPAGRQTPSEVAAITMAVVAIRAGVCCVQPRVW